MTKKKKSGNQDSLVKAIVLITAIINLIRAISEIINKLIE